MNATARPPFPPPKPSLSRLVYISSVNGLAYRKATYGLWGAVCGDIWSRILHISEDWYSDHLRMGEPPPMAAYCFWILGVRRREMRGPR